MREDAAAEKLLVRRARLVQVRDLAIDRVVASRGSGIYRTCRAYPMQPTVNNLGVDHPHEYVIPGRSKFLEVGRFSHLNKGIQGVSAVQRVGLEPFLPPGLSRGSGVYVHTKSSWHEILDDSLTDQWRRCDTVGLVRRANDDYAHGRSRTVGVRDWTSINTGYRIDHASEGIGQRHIEHVVCHLPGGVATAARIVPEHDLEVSETHLMHRVGVRPSSRVGLTIERPVILEDEHCNRGRGQRAGFYIHGHTGRQRARAGRAACRAGWSDGCATHCVAAHCRALTCGC